MFEKTQKGENNPWINLQPCSCPIYAQTLAGVCLHDSQMLLILLVKLFHSLSTSSSALLWRNRLPILMVSVGLHARSLKDLDSVPEVPKSSWKINYQEPILIFFMTKILIKHVQGGSSYNNWHVSSGLSYANKHPRGSRHLIT